MAQFVAEVISDKPGYGNAAAAVQNVAAAFLGSGVIPIGTVEWAASSDPTLPAATGYAAPLLPWSTSIPVEGEFILVFSAPSPTQTQGDSVAESFFYLGPIGIDGDKNKNAAKGFMNRTTNAFPTIPAIYKMSVKQMPPFQPLQGDTLIQDRNGSCIRMSSTQHPLASQAGKKALWKKPGFVPLAIGPSFVPGAAGNPIISITVGPQGNATDASSLAGGFTGTKTIFENLNKAKADRSSIIMTSDQTVTFDHQRGGWKHLKQIFSSPVAFSLEGKGGDGSKSYDGGHVKDETYKNSHFGSLFQPVATYPSTPTQPALSQIILTSDRIVIDSRADSVLINGFRDVKIGTKGWNMETNSTMNVIHEGIKQTLVLTQHVQEVAKHLDEALAILEKIQFPTGVGPTGPCLDPYFKEIGALRKVLDTTRKHATIRSDQFDKLSEEFVKQKRTERSQDKVF